MLLSLSTVRSYSAKTNPVVGDLNQSWDEYHYCDNGQIQLHSIDNVFYVTPTVGCIIFMVGQSQNWTPTTA